MPDRGVVCSETRYSRFRIQPVPRGRGRDWGAWAAAGPGRSALSVSPRGRPRRWVLNVGASAISRSPETLSALASTVPTAVSLNRFNRAIDARCASAHRGVRISAHPGMAQAMGRPSRQRPESRTLTRRVAQADCLGDRPLPTAADRPRSSRTSAATLWWRPSLAPTWRL
jgi:hypothetical protein